jgi:hypothetical protein
MKATIQEAAEPTMKGIEVKKCWEKDDTEKMNESDGKRSEWEHDDAKRLGEGRRGSVDGVRRKKDGAEEDMIGIHRLSISNWSIQRRREVSRAGRSRGAIWIVHRRSDGWNFLNDVDSLTVAVLDLL